MHQKDVDQKFLWVSRTSSEPLKSIMKKDASSISFLITVIWNLKKRKGKNSKLHFRQLVSRTTNFFTSGICYWQIRWMLLILCIFNKPNIWYLWSLTILGIKRWFPCQSFPGPLFVVGVPKSFKLLPDISFESGFKEDCIVEFTAVFLCLLLTWSRQYSMWCSNKFNGP